MTFPLRTLTIYPINSKIKEYLSYKDSLNLDIALGKYDCLENLIYNNNTKGLVSSNILFHVDLLL